MYAVLKTGGKQYKVAENDVIIVEKLAGEAGGKIDLDEVLMIGDGETSKVGTPMLDGAKVTAEVLEQKRGKKVIVFKKKRRQNYRRTRGHRQELTVLRITDILADGKKKASKAKAKAKAEEAPVEAAAPETAPEATENKE
jgi:large subunit ribosomal protein L21